MQTWIFLYKWTTIFNAFAFIFYVFQIYKLLSQIGMGGAVRFLVVGTIGQEERPPRGQLWMDQCLTSLKYWPI